MAVPSCDINLCYVCIIFELRVRKCMKFKAGVVGPESYFYSTHDVKGCCAVAAVMIKLSISNYVFPWDSENQLLRQDN